MMRHRVTATLSVELADGVHINDWLAMHDGMNREVTLVGRSLDNYQLAIVRVSYESKGASVEDILRPYLLRAKWKKLAKVELIDYDRKVIVDA